MKYLAMGLIRLYQMTLSPLLGPRCRFYPSCSRYGYQAFATHGLFRGGLLTCWRLVRCNPWNHGGIDEVPPARARSRTARLKPSDPMVSHTSALLVPDPPSSPDGPTTNPGTTSPVVACPCSQGAAE